MTRHILDLPRDTTDSSRLDRFLQIARRDLRHHAIDQLLRRPRARYEDSGRVAGLLRPQRGQTV